MHYYSFENRQVSELYCISQTQYEQLVMGALQRILWGKNFEAARFDHPIFQLMTTVHRYSVCRRCLVGPKLAAHWSEVALVVTSMWLGPLPTHPKELSSLPIFGGLEFRPLYKQHFFSLIEMLENNFFKSFKSAEIRTRDCRVNSGNVTSVLCRPL